MAYISKGLTLFLLSTFLLICLSTCYIVKRKAPDGQLYVFSNRKGCVSVQSQMPCTVSWQLNAHLAKTYDQSNKVVASQIQLYRNFGLDNNCIQALQKSLCSQATPKCSTVDDTSEYGDTTTLCNDVYSSCPQSIVDGLKKNNFCQSLKTGKTPNNPACVAPLTPVAGVCPQPQFKMSPDFLEGYRKLSTTLVKTYGNLQNLKYDNGKRMYSDECLSQMKDISCSPLYCSADENQLLIKHDQEDCYQIVKNCFDEPLSKLSEYPSLESLMNTLKRQLESSCDTFPKSSAQLRPKPLTEAAPTSSKDNPATTKSQQNSQARAKTTSSGNNQLGHPFLLAALAFLFMKTYE